MGNKTSILHILYALFPLNYERYIEPFGGSGAVLLGKKKPDKFEVYNDFNHNLVNLFRCMRDRPMAFIKELGFYPLNSRDDFNAIKHFFKQEKFEDKYLDEELELTKIILPDLKAEEIIELYVRMKQDYDLRRAVMFLKLLRYSYSSGGKSFACQPFSVMSLFQLIEQVGKRLENTVIENQDFEVLIKHYDRENAFFYCDPPYFSSEYVYQCGFTWDDHQRLKNTLANSKGKWLVSYNDCEEIRNLYDGYSFFDFTRLHNMKQRINAGEQFPELLISNYDMYERQRNKPLQLSLLDLTTEQQIDLEQILKECIINHGK
jgi:DNA adenine methylase